jgi:DNA replication and repair protein RecF
MTLSRLSLSNFRSYSDVRIEPGPGFVVLTGENGSGKTNVLEAISLLTPGRGLRGVPLTDIARQGGPGNFAIAAQIGDIDLGTGTATNAPERRLVRINGAAASATSLSEWLSVIWVTPAMDRIFSDSAGERRRFLDRLVLALSPQHASHAARYEAAMRQRNKLLGEEGAPDPDWLTALEEQMVEHGTAVAAARATLVTDLGERLARQPESPFARAALSLEGWRPTDNDAYRRSLREGRGRDSSARRTLAGPHRSDLGVVHASKNRSAASCSTGEQKALLLGIVLAHADLVADRVDRRPVLLLDEVAAHLDPKRRAALFERLAAQDGQVWMTGTESSLFGEIGTTVSWLHVENGSIHLR